MRYICREMNDNTRPKLIKITNSAYFQVRQLQGQLGFLSSYFDVIAVAPKGDGWQELANQGVTCIPVKMSRTINPFADVFTIIQLVKLFKKERPNIVHTHTPKAGLLGMIAAWIVRIPIRMHTVTGFPILTAVGLKKKILYMTEAVTYFFSTNVYPNSKNLSKIISSMGLCGDKKMRVIGNGSSNGIDTEYYSRKVVDKINVSKYDFTFVFVGRIFHEKGIEELIYSFKSLQKDYPNVGLRLVGFMEENIYPVSDWVKNEIKINANIEFVGFQKDIRPYLLGCDVFVFPSYREGFPNVVMQAGALDLPQIVTDINGSNEIVVNGENGLIVPPKDKYALYNAMKYFLDNPQEVVRMSLNARDMVKHRYERKEFWGLLLKEYNRLLDYESK